MYKYLMLLEKNIRFNVLNCHYNKGNLAKKYLKVNTYKLTEIHNVYGRIRKLFGFAIRNTLSIMTNEVKVFNKPRR